MHRGVVTLLPWSWGMRMLVRKMLASSRNRIPSSAKGLCGSATTAASQGIWLLNALLHLPAQTAQNGRTTKPNSGELRRKLDVLRLMRRETERAQAAW